MNWNRKFINSNLVLAHFTFTLCKLTPVRPALKMLSFWFGESVNFLYTILICLSKIVVMFDISAWCQKYLSVCPKSFLPFNKPVIFANFIPERHVKFYCNCCWIEQYSNRWSVPSSATTLWSKHQKNDRNEDDIKRSKVISCDRQIFIPRKSTKD